MCKFGSIHSSDWARLALYVGRECNILAVNIQYVTRALHAASETKSWNCAVSESASFIVDAIF